MSIKTYEIKNNVDLKPLTTIKIAGVAKEFIVIHSIEGLKDSLREFVNKPYYILGNGSNLLINDNEINTPVVTLAEEFSYVKEDNEFIEVGARTPLSKLLSFMISNQLSGIEHLSGIPATIGGMLIMNASSFGSSISQKLAKVEIVDKDGQVKILKCDDIDFGYRQSSLKGSFITRAWFSLTKDSSVKRWIRSVVIQRSQRGDFDYPSCGCIFKNPTNESAGKLIDQCGFKGKQSGGAMVSKKHANFIVNTGNATYSDVDKLINEIKDAVLAKYKIQLEEEIERWL
jgi:UDP-N-acetylmuramate dehydrogenase